MHILLIHQAFATLDEAGGTRHYEFARYLSKQGFRFTIIASEQSYLSGSSSSLPPTHQEPGAEEISIIRIRTKVAMHESFLKRLCAYMVFMLASLKVALKIKTADVVWGTSPPIFQAFTAMILAKIRHLPFLFEVRDLWPDFAIELGVIKGKAIIGLSRWLEKTLVKNADVVIINSPGYLAHVKKLGARRTELIPNGADPDMFLPVSLNSPFKNELGLEEKFLVTYTGAHGMSNDLGTVLAAAKILSRHPDIHFLLVGDGKEKKNLVRQAQEMNLRNITFLPPIPKNRMREVLAASDACLAILKPIEFYKTTYPNKVFDYMAAGRPVICAIDGVIREVIEKSKSGVYVPPGDSQALADAVVNLRDHPRIRSQMGSAGRKVIKAQYNRKKISDQLIQVLLSVKKD